MAYLGGKSKGYQHIINILNSKCFDNFDYLEPFIGYAHILRRVKHKRSYIAGDSNLFLYTLLDYIQNSNNDYPNITKEEYYLLKNDNSSRNLLRKSFAAFTYSYNGKEFAGYTGKLHGRNYPKERKRYYDQLRNNDTFMNTDIRHVVYDKFKPKNKLIYCDPPYESTTSYKTGYFDHEKFWDIMRKWSKNNYVFVSEYKAPNDFILISSTRKRGSLSGKGSKDTRIEKLFAHESIINTPLYYCIKNSLLNKSHRRTRKI